MYVNAHKNIIARNCYFHFWQFYFSHKSKIAENLLLQGSSIFSLEGGAEVTSLRLLGFTFRKEVFHFRMDNACFFQTILVFANWVQSNTGVPFLLKTWTHVLRKMNESGITNTGLLFCSGRWWDGSGLIPHPVQSAEMPTEKRAFSACELLELCPGVLLEHQIPRQKGYTTTPMGVLTISEEWTGVGGWG